MRTFVIGDVHGCREELRRLYKLLEPRTNDRFVFLGDLVDKGLDTVGVLRYVRALIAFYPGSVCVAGNHESKAIERYKKDKEHPKAENWWQQASSTDWEFIHQMPLYARFEELNLLVIHGGIYPRFFNLYPQGLDDEKLLGRPWYKGGNKYQKRAKRMLYTRYIDPETGNNVPLWEENENTPLWASVYDGREGFVIYGHQPQMDFLPKFSEHALGIDTACSSGGRLTAAVLIPNKKIEFVWVDATDATKEASISKKGGSDA